jgi:hypothetical protein
VLNLGFYFKVRRQIEFHELAWPPDITAMIETGRILLLRKNEPINKQNIKMGAVSAQHNRTQIFV